MNIKLIDIIDKIIIMNIYFAFVMDIPILQKLSFISSILIYSLLILNRKSFNNQATFFILTVFAMFSSLLTIGLIQGNEFNDAFKFVVPIFSLINIFIYVELSKKYELQRYLFHYYIVSILIVLKILLLFFLFTNNLMVDYLPVFDPNKNQSTWITFNAGSLRIFVGQAIIIPIGLLLSQYLYGKTPYLFLFISLPALFMTQTTVLWFSYILVLIYLIHIRFKNIFKYLVYFLALFFLIMLITSYYNVLSDIVNEKLLYSAPVKLAQISIALNSFEENFLFGGGLGYIYSNGANTIEVVILHVLSTTGIIGFLFYGYMLFYWFVVSIKFIKKDKMTEVLLLSFFTVVFASFSNPYLIGANSGLFLIPIMAARFLQLNTNLLIRQKETLT